MSSEPTTGDGMTRERWLGPNARPTDRVAVAADLGYEAHLKLSFQIDELTAAEGTRHLTTDSGDASWVFY